MNGIQRWIDTHAVGFAGIGFFVSPGGQWSSEALTVTKRVPGSNAFVTQFLGRGPETATYDLVFGSIDAFHNAKQLQGTVGTLTLPADVAALNDRSPTVIGGERYDRLGGVLLVGIDPGSVAYDNGGIVRCSATFQRAVSDVPIAILRMGAA